ncbi:MAG: hypothetical protein WBQ72_01065 [Terriglobales bacterium]
MIQATRIVFARGGGHVPRSLRVAVVGHILIILFFFAVTFVFLLVFFLVWFLSKEDIGSYRPIRKV